MDAGLLAQYIMNGLMLGMMYALVAVGFTLFFAMLMIGGESASRRLGVPNFFVLVLVALLLIFLALVEYLDFLRRKRRTA
jgi:simple sugar transport system permease protein